MTPTQFSALIQSGMGAASEPERERAPSGKGEKRRREANASAGEGAEGRKALMPQIVMTSVDTKGYICLSSTMSLNCTQVVGEMAFGLIG